MLMATATHTVGSAHSSSMSPPSPWQPFLLVPNNHHPQEHQELYDDDRDLATPSTFPSPTTPASSPPGPRHNHLRPAASRQRAGKRRRPRPSRKLPTTYISADAASFRHMVHQVTGADDDDVPPLLHLHGGPVVAAGPEVLCCRRQAPAPPPSARAGLETTTLLLPTLDTSAFLMLGAAGAGGCGGRAAPARAGVSSCCHGSAVDPGAMAMQVRAEEACGGAGSGLPSLDSRDDDDALF